MSRIAVIASFYLSFLLFPNIAHTSHEPEAEEITVYLNVEGLGGTDLDVVIKDKEAYLSITELFKYLKIKNEVSRQQDSISGFYINQNDTYLIDKKNNQIRFKDKVWALGADDLIQTPAGLYLRAKLIKDVFALDCAFNFRTLSIQLTTKLDLPVFHEKRQELMRQNISKLKSEIIADTTITKAYKAFNIGTADWAASSSQSGSTTYTAASLKLGAVIAGGETTLGFNYQSNIDLQLRQQSYLWRYVDNDNPLLRQILVGQIPTQPISSLLGPLIGVQLTNASTIFRKSMGSYTLSDVTNPDWVVELYINNVLVDYKKADASGFFSFQVPMVYGSSTILLKFLGPWGEQQTREQTVSVPYNFLPKKEIEYTISNGVVDDIEHSRFSREELKYGLSNRITVGSGIEYLSSITSAPAMPFINLSYRPSSNLFLSGDYAYNIRAKAIVNYKMPRDLLLEFDYTTYKEGQQAILNSYSEERKVMISKQFRSRGFNLYSRVSLDQIIYPTSKQTLADLLLSSTWQGISSNLTTYSLLVDQASPNVYSNLALSFRLPHNTTFRPQLQYNYSRNQLTSYRIEMEKQFFRSGFLNLAFDNNLLYKIPSLTLGLRFDLSFARTSFTASTSHHVSTTTQTISGGALYDKKAGYFKLNNNSNVGKAGLIIYPYLDLNGNNRRDANEPKIAGLQLKINGGRTENNVKDTTTRVFELQPFTSYLLELNPASFDNIAWQLKNITYKVITEPNQLKLIEIPVQVFGEVSGTVYTSGADSTGIGRIKVNIYRDGKTLVKSALTEDDGYFDFLGLPPGSYTARLDEVQLSRIEMKAAFTIRAFKIKPTIDGDVAKNINFKLSK